MTLKSRNAATMQSAQMAYDNATDPRWEADDGQQVFTGAFGERYMLCDCDHAWIVYDSTSPLACPECGSDNFLDKTAAAKRDRWLAP